ncbi:hypothetical protein [Devosia sp. Leaf64]|uniref:hypothetical protein n=1 Tax=Devosia sp. Leaf64 TaxID=1736229 RepID=UPI000713E4AD|nr:hypothetical protein [Devosia sp. Leaf64]KQN78181.1 hypothetical protein ASE94_14395 [Devosia sp. Leaf64]
MPRLSLALSLLAVLVPAAYAQEAAPATSPKITVDPRAIVDSMPQQGTLLTGLYATQATIELCSVEAGEPATTAMNAHRRQLESEMRMDDATSAAAYAAIKGDVEKAGVDCAEGSKDRQQTAEVIAIYSGAGATPAQPASPMDPAAPAPSATPADPAAPATPATPAQ